MPRLRPPLPPRPPQPRWRSRLAGWLRGLAESIEPSPFGLDLAGAPPVWADHVRVAARRTRGAVPRARRWGRRPRPATTPLPPADLPPSVAWPERELPDRAGTPPAAARRVRSEPVVTPGQPAPSAGPAAPPPAAEPPRDLPAGPPRQRVVPRPPPAPQPGARQASLTDPFRAALAAARRGPLVRARPAEPVGEPPTPAARPSAPAEPRARGTAPVLRPVPAGRQNSPAPDGTSPSAAAPPRPAPGWPPSPDDPGRPDRPDRPRIAGRLASGTPAGSSPPALPVQPALRTDTAAAPVGEWRITATPPYLPAAAVLPHTLWPELPTRPAPAPVPAPAAGSVGRRQRLAAEQGAT